MKTVLINDIKKGTELIMKDGAVKAFMMDNKKGFIRCLRVTAPFDEIGDSYVDLISMALIDGEWCKVVLDENQKKKLRAIHEMGF